MAPGVRALWRSLDPGDRRRLHASVEELYTKVSDDFDLRIGASSLKAFARKKFGTALAALCFGITITRSWAKPERLMSIFVRSQLNTREESARIVVLPVPYDETSTWMKGPTAAEAIITPWPYGALRHEHGSESSPSIFTPRRSARNTRRRDGAAVRRGSALSRKGKFVVVVGGEHR